MCGCGGCEVGGFVPALWTWGSTTHWSSLTWLLHRPRTAIHCEYHPPFLTNGGPLGLPLWPLSVASLGSYVCSRSGHILEIDHHHLAVRCARRLLPTQTHNSPLSQKQTFSSGRWPLLHGEGSPDVPADAAPPPGPGIAIISLSVSQATCAVGSVDGYLRLWPMDFSCVLLEAGRAKTVPCHHGHHRKATSLDWMAVLGFCGIVS